MTLPEPTVCGIERMLALRITPIAMKVPTIKKTVQSPENGGVSKHCIEVDRDTND